MVLFTGFLEGGLMIVNIGKLAKTYVLSWKFVIDIISILPFDIFYLWIGVKAFLRMNRLVKLWRFTEFFDMAETHTNFPNLIRISNVILYIMILIHWFGCLYFGASYLIGFGTDEWVYPKPVGRKSEFWVQYSDSFYWATLTLTTIGDTQWPYKPIEIWFCVLCSLLGVLIFATVFGNVGAMIKNMDGERIRFQFKVDSVKRYMELRGIGPDLQERVVKWFDYTWKNKQSVDDKETLRLFPEKLRAELSIHIHMETLRKVTILDNCEPGLLVELVTKLRLQVFSPGDYICRKGDIGREMFIVKRGKLQVISEDEQKVFVTLTEGAVFGEISVLNIVGNKTGNRRTASVKSLGFSDLFVLSKQDFWSVLKDYSDSTKLLKERGKVLLRKDDLLDEEAEARQDRKNLDMAEKIELIRDFIEDIKITNSAVNETVNEMTQKVDAVDEIKQSIKDVNGRLDKVTDQIAAVADLATRAFTAKESGTSLRNDLEDELVSPKPAHQPGHQTIRDQESRKSVCCTLM